MEKHRCKLCLKTFANGRALGGHMRSHMVNLYVPPKAEHQHQLHEEADSASSSSASDADEENGERDLLGYGLRENPKKSIRLVDPEFSFAADVGSVVLQDRESETESSKNPVRRRSKRIRKSGISEHHHYHHDHHHQCQEHQEIKKPKSGKTEPSWAEQEPVSSISDATTEEDVAYCLMMLSRDKWMRDDEADEDESEPEESKKWLDEDETDGSEELKQRNGRARRKYKCETCHKVFRSYQALGGHRASHKKSRGAAQNIITTTTHPPSEAERRNAGTSEQKTHECPVCFKVFSSGQALGGHKRSHVLGSAPALSPPPPPPEPPSKIGEPLIDLNLPAQIDEDDISQIELSAVSDAEFVYPIKH